MRRYRLVLLVLAVALIEIIWVWATDQPGPAYPEGRFTEFVVWAAICIGPLVVVLIALANRNRLK